ncbi:hypothetical protein SAMN04515672_2690 [Natronorubrum texcoconense]|uniref:Uncharacterized protein n=1 Tax=Natronorubrum texcoconense TaxID=1095776 RepID=A0A1G9ADV0_9EURY|nr:hypothetical protein SAMN04515672_2690 [Natronorubrum texcoconense]
MPAGGSERTLAHCVACGSAYAAEIRDDETIQPIGMRTGCDCGSNEFQTLDDSAGTDRQDDQYD